MSGQLTMKGKRTGMRGGVATTTSGAARGCAKAIVRSGLAASCSWEPPSDISRHLAGVNFPMGTLSIDQLLRFSRVPAPLRSLAELYLKQMPRA